MMRIAPFLALAALALPGSLAAFAGPSRERPPVARPLAEHDQARASRYNGEIKPLGVLLQRAHAAVGPAEYLGVEPDIGSASYRFKFMRANGQVVWVDVDGRSGRVRAIR